MHKKPISIGIALALSPFAITCAGKQLDSQSARPADVPVKHAATDEKIKSLADEPVGPRPNGPGMACTTSGCMAGQNPCGKAACMSPPDGGAPVCEYAPKLTGSCRCWPGDKRPCTLPGGASGLKTCLAHPTNIETYWTICS